MSKQTAQMSLWNKRSNAVADALITSRWDGRDAVLSLASPDLDLSLTARGRDVFDGLQQLRRELEPLGWYPLCNGARVDCYPSGMARDMGGGRSVYVLTIEDKGRKPRLVGTLEPAPREKVGTVAEQDTYFRRWLDAPRVDVAR